ncbi:MAG: LysR family transcriptional regulator [Lautropia sp.]|nr:LysR family transcriptional regulator [Lautropia sp.]
MDASTYGQIRLLHAIAREGSISGAARRNGITAASASHALKLLEQKTGVPLFSRTSRQLHLTEAGRALIADTGDALAALDRAGASLGEHGDVPKGPVRITLPRIAYQIVLQPHLGELCRRLPEIQPDISIDDGTRDLVADGFDLGIRFGHSLVEGVVARQLTEPIRMGLYASAEYLAEHGMPERPEDLAGHRFLYYRFHASNQLSPLELRDEGRTVRVEAPDSFVSNSTDVLADAAGAGLGITRIFEPIHERLPEGQRLQPVLPAYWQTYPPLYLYYRQNTQKARRVRALAEFLQAVGGADV